MAAMATAAGPSECRTALEALVDHSKLIRFVLPDGELGRPGENLYPMTFIQDRPRKLLVELGSEVLLVITEPALDKADEHGVTVRFEQLTFDWQEFANYRPHAKTYPSGQVDFLPQGIAKGVRT